MYTYKENGTEAHTYQTTETKAEERWSYVKRVKAQRSILLVWSRAKAACSGISGDGTNFLIGPEAV